MAEDKASVDSLTDSKLSVKSFNSAFMNLSGNVGVIPRLWDRHRDILNSDKAFKDNINALNYDDVPVMWGGKFNNLPDANLLIGGFMDKLYALPPNILFFNETSGSLESIKTISVKTSEVSPNITYNEKNL